MKTNQAIAKATIEKQTKLVIENLRLIRVVNGMRIGDVVSTQVLMTDLHEFSRIQAIHGTLFNEKPSARTTVEVARLPRYIKIEIAAITIKKENLAYAYMKSMKIKKTLCKLDKHDMEECMDTIVKLVAEPHYLCSKCARVATEKKYLCKPVKIKVSKQKEE